MSRTSVSFMNLFLMSMMISTMGFLSLVHSSFPMNSQSPGTGISATIESVLQGIDVYERTTGNTRKYSHEKKYLQGFPQYLFQLQQDIEEEMKDKQVSENKSQAWDAVIAEIQRLIERTKQTNQQQAGTLGMPMAPGNSVGMGIGLGTRSNQQQAGVGAMRTPVVTPGNPVGVGVGVGTRSGMVPNTGNSSQLMGQTVPPSTGTPPFSSQIHSAPALTSQNLRGNAGQSQQQGVQTVINPQSPQRSMSPTQNSLNQNTFNKTVSQQSVPNGPRIPQRPASVASSQTTAPSGTPSASQRSLQQRAQPLQKQMSQKR